MTFLLLAGEQPFATVPFKGIKMRKKQLMDYCKQIEERNLKLRREIDEVKRGADELAVTLDAILAAVVDRFGDFEIDMPKIGRSVNATAEDGKLKISRKDAQEPINPADDEKCEGLDTTTSS